MITLCLVYRSTTLNTLWCSCDFIIQFIMNFMIHMRSFMVLCVFGTALRFKCIVIWDILIMSVQLLSFLLR